MQFAAHVRTLKQMQLSLIRGIDVSETEYSGRLFQGGIELFRQRNETVVDFCFDP